MEHENLRNNTEKMYDNTLEEMKKRGASEEEIEIVRLAKESAISAYDREEEEVAEEYATKYKMSEAIDNIGRIPSFITPLMSNLFIVHIGNVPIYQIRSFYFSPDDKSFSIGFNETKEFSVLNYFTENKKFDGVTLEFLTQLGETIRRDTFKSVSVSKTMVDGLTYEAGRPFGLYIKFNYKKYVPSAN